MKYKLRRSVGIPAETVVNEFERINSECGGVTAEVVLDEARPEEAPLHPAFLWDDTEAAERYRLWQARDLVRAVHIVDDEGEDRGSAYVRVVTIDDEEIGSVYKPVAEVVSNPSLFASALRELRNKLAGAKRAISDLEREAREAGQLKNEKSLFKALRSVEQAESHLDSVSA